MTVQDKIQQKKDKHSIFQKLNIQGAAQIYLFIFLQLEQIQITMAEIYQHKSNYISNKNVDKQDSLPEDTSQRKNLSQSINSPQKQETSLTHKIYDIIEANERIIPGYNYQSLFRKKSHIRLARKKNKEETQKRNPNIKHQLGQKQAKNIQKGHWTNEQNKLYHWFLQLHNRHFVLKYLRRTDKIFKSMANFIRSRQAEQCRSHHQKMQKKYHTFYQILFKLRMDFYGTANTDILKLELQQNGYKIKQNTLITQTEIKNGDIMNKDAKIQQIEDDSIRNYLQPSERQSKEHSNLLGQNYQNGLTFANMHY